MKIDATRLRLVDDEHPGRGLGRGTSGGGSGHLIALQFRFVVTPWLSVTPIAGTSWEQMPSRTLEYGKSAARFFVRVRRQKGGWFLAIGALFADMTLHVGHFCFHGLKDCGLPKRQRNEFGHEKSKQRAFFAAAKKQKRPRRITGAPSFTAGSKRMLRACHPSKV